MVLIRAISFFFQSRKEFMLVITIGSPVQTYSRNNLRFLLYTEQSWINRSEWLNYLVSSPQERSYCAPLLAVMVPSQTCRNWWNIWGIITSPTYFSCELIFLILFAKLVKKGFNNVTFLVLKVWELSHKVAILPWPPDSPAHLFQNATGQNKVYWTYAPSSYCCDQPKHNPHVHGQEPTTAGFNIYTPGTILPNPKSRRFLPCGCPWARLCWTASPWSPLLV